MPHSPSPLPHWFIDLDVVGHNLSRLHGYVQHRRLNLRPHTKTHKSVRTAALQMVRGATGITAAKVGEAETIAAAAGDLQSPELRLRGRSGGQSVR